MQTEIVRAYLDGPFQRIQGWCIPHIWQVIQPLAQSMAADGISNPIAEIGVFHGKFFIGLMKAFGQQKNYAIDVFSMQQFNLDGAGKGNLGVFQSNIVASGEALSAIRAIEKDSMTITADDISAWRADTGGFSIFSVDGCHTVEHTINDTRVAMQLTVPQGIIFVDDYYNPSWPGVQEGITRMYLFETPKFVPLAYACNKLLLCHISFHTTYLTALHAFLRANFPETAVRKVKRFGYECFTVAPRVAEPRYIA